MGKGEVQQFLFDAGPGPDPEGSARWEQVTADLQRFYPHAETRRRMAAAVGRLRAICPDPANLDVPHLYVCRDALLGSVAPTTLHSYLRDLAVICRHLHDCGFHARPLFEYRRAKKLFPKLGPAERARGAVLTAEDLERLLDWCERQTLPSETASGPREGLRLWRAERLQALVWLVSHTGIRAGEALHLRWDRVDLETGWIRIEPDAASGWRPKTAQSVRPIPLPHAARNALLGWSRCLPRGDYVFPTSADSGKPWCKGSTHWRYRPVRCVREAGQGVGIERLTLLALRHHWCSRVVELGWTGSQIAVWMGHASEQTRWNYTHPLADELERRAKGLRLVG